MPNQPARCYDHMWKRQNTDVLKINVDAAFQHETHSGATGAITRDGRGIFIAAATCFFPQVCSVSSTEMKMIRNGLYLAGRIGSNKVLIKSNCSFVLDSLKAPETYVGSDVTTILESKQLALDFASISYMHRL